MKKILYPVSVSAFLVLLVAFVCLSAQTSGPKIFIEEKTFDAKEIKSTNYLEHTFKVNNKGDSILEIAEVQTT